jgi:H+-translocating NAD(P) transhydrogenase subunit alpha
MQIGVPREIEPGEKRVATTPDVVGHLIKLGYSVVVEQGAGENASFNDEDYRAAGAAVESDTRALWSGSEIILKVRAPAHHPDLDVDESELLSNGTVLVSFIWPAQNDGADEQSRRARPRSAPWTRAAHLAGPEARCPVVDGQYRRLPGGDRGRQSLRAVSSPARSPPRARFRRPRSSSSAPAWPGLAAIGAAGAWEPMVRAFDTRPEVKEQVESMGAEFLELDIEEEGSGTGGYAKEMSEEFIKAEMALFRAQAEEVDIIITTALIPGKPAPRLITADMVKSMKGSVIVDLAAEQGGNCELTEPGEVVVRHDVTIIGYADLPSRLAAQSSQLYATNLRHLLTELTPGKDGRPTSTWTTRSSAGCTVIKDGEITWPPPAPKLSAGQAEAGRRSRSDEATRWPPARNPVPDIPDTAAVGGLALLGLGRWRRRSSCALHGVRAGLFRRLPGDLECDPRAAHASDERHQRHQQHRSSSGALLQISGLRPRGAAGGGRGADHQHQHVRWVPTSPSACCNMFRK